MSKNDIAVVNQVVNDKYAIYEGDCMELIKSVSSDQIHFGIHSPPFISLYKFSDYDRDLSNSEGADFWQHYGFLISELYRVTMPGRLHAVHCMDLVASKRMHGEIGILDFRGDIIRAYQKAGWIYSGATVIWKNAAAAQARTKSHRLNHSQIVKDANICGPALCDYLLAFRKPGVNAEPISGCIPEYVGDGDYPIIPTRTDPIYDKQSDEEIMQRATGAYPELLEPTGAPDRQKWTNANDTKNWYSIETWRMYASPVWTDIRQNRVLRYQAARDKNDLQHVSPLQLDVIERAILLWSKPGETVLTPFLGVGSEVWAAVNMDRVGIGFELKPSYWIQASRNLEELTKHKATAGTGLFDNV